MFTDEYKSGFDPVKYWADTFGDGKNYSRIYVREYDCVAKKIEPNAADFVIEMPDELTKKKKKVSFGIVEEIELEADQTGARTYWFPNNNSGRGVGNSIRNGCGFLFYVIVVIICAFCHCLCCMCSPCGNQDWDIEQGSQESSSPDRFGERFQAVTQQPQSILRSESFKMEKLGHLDEDEELDKESGQRLLMEQTGDSNADGIANDDRFRCLLSTDPFCFFPE